LGDEGLAIIADTVDRQQGSADMKSNVGNLPGIPS
jgi:hypothetical protein